MRKFTAVLLVSLVLSGCASVNMGDATQDAAAKTFVAPPNQAAVYIYRNESIGAAVKMDVAINGAPVGQTAANTFLHQMVAPGKLTISSKAENTDALEIDAKPGMLYFIWQEVKMGVLYARTKLHLVDEQQGRKGVLETRLAAPR